MVDKIDTDNQSGFTRRRSLSEQPDLPPVTEGGDAFIGGTTWEQMPGKEDGQTVDEHKDAVRGTLSKKGTPYDPLLHSYPPSMTQAGEWKKRRNVKPKGGAEQTDGVSNADYRRAATQAGMLYAQLNHIALGEGAEPIESEVLPVIDAFENWYLHNGIQEVPPWAGLVLGLGGYTYTVASRPKPRQRVKEWWFAAKAYFGFGGDDARNDSGKLGNRENESSEVVRKHTPE